MDQEKINTIKKKLQNKDYDDKKAEEDISLLLSKIDGQDEKIKILTRHILELTQEIENVRSDFGGDQR